jgi:hypothetical protein
MAKKAKKNKNKEQRRFQQLSQIQKQIIQQPGDNNVISSVPAVMPVKESSLISEIKYTGSQDYSYVLKDLGKVALFFAFVLIIYGFFYYVFNHTGLIKF